MTPRDEFVLFKQPERRLQRMASVETKLFGLLALFAATGLLIGDLSAAPAQAEKPSGGFGTLVTFEVLNPRGEIPLVPPTGIVPRLKDLDGRKIGLVDNSKLGADYFLKAVEESLRKKFPGATIAWFRNPQTTMGVKPELYREVAQKSDTFVWATGDTGTAAWWASHDTIQIEKLGKPGVSIVTDNFFEYGQSAAKENGMPGLRIVPMPTEQYFKARVSVEEMRPIAAGTIDAIVNALIRPLTPEEDKPKPVAKETGERIKISEESYTAALEKLNQTFLERNWSDGLPIVPPTQEAVKWMLTGTSRSPGEVLGKVPIKNGIATIEKIAINSVMAGAKPEYLPVIIAAMEALLDKNYDLAHVQGSAGSVTPVIIVNGPIAKELDINSKMGYLGYGWRANIAIGRAVRLCLINLGHMWPTLNDMALTGREASFGNFTFAENETDSPWRPYHEDAGFRAEDSTVTVSSMMWLHRQGPGGAVTPSTPDESMQSLAKILSFMGFPSVSTKTWLMSKNYIVAMDPGLARSLSKAGYTKKDVQQWFYENARNPYSEFSESERKTLNQYIADGRIPPNVLSKEQLKEGARIPIVPSPENIHVFIVGDIPSYTGVWGYPGPRFGHQTKQIRGATLTKAGR
jgi:hypothetical protein